VTASTKLDETDLFLPTLDRASECSAIEPKHFVQVEDAKDYVIELTYVDHGFASLGRLTLIITRPRHTPQERPSMHRVG
jgi:hypothetical protein